MDVVLVPPSADNTSQSIFISFSDKSDKFRQFLKLLPINLCISCVLPDSFPLIDSLSFLVFVDVGNIEYSAVSHP